MNSEKNQFTEDWDMVIEPRSSLFSLNLREVWGHGYLLMMFVRRDLVSVYKQTILGPLWFFIQPLLTTITFTIIFGNIAKISTDGLPQGEWPSSERGAGRSNGSRCSRSIHTDALRALQQRRGSRACRNRSE